MALIPPPKLIWELQQCKWLVSTYHGSLLTFGRTWRSGLSCASKTFAAFFPPASEVYLFSWNWMNCEFKQLLGYSSWMKMTQLNCKVIFVHATVGHTWIPLEKHGGGMGQVFCSTKLPGNPLSTNWSKIWQNFSTFWGGCMVSFWNVDFCHLKCFFSTKF